MATNELLNTFTEKENQIAGIMHTLGKSVIDAITVCDTEKQIAMETAIELLAEKFHVDASRISVKTKMSQRFTKMDKSGNRNDMIPLMKISYQIAIAGMGPEDKKPSEELVFQKMM